MVDLYMPYDLKANELTHMRMNNRPITMMAIMRVVTDFPTMPFIFGTNYEAWPSMSIV